MNYDLAKKLKDAGFPQELHPRGGYLGTRKMPLPYDSELVKNEEYAKFPTFSELIESIPLDVKNGRDHGTFALEYGGDFGIPKNGKIWVCGYNYCYSDKGCGIEKGEWGDTPESAVANFWLSLNKKPE